MVIFILAVSLISIVLICMMLLYMSYSHCLSNHVACQGMLDSGTTERKYDKKMEFVDRDKAKNVFVESTRSHTFAHFLFVTIIGWFTIFFLLPVLSHACSYCFVSLSPVRQTDRQTDRQTNSISLWHAHLVATQW